MVIETQDTRDSANDARGFNRGLVVGVTRDDIGLATILVDIGRYKVKLQGLKKVLQYRDSPYIIL